MSFYVPDITVELGNLKPFSKVHRVRVQSTWREITDTCRIWMPKNIRVKQGDQVLESLNDTVKRGQPVKITGGYKPNPKVEFQGFVRSVKKNIPIEIECEDYAYLLTLDTFSQSWKSVTLRELVSYILQGDRLQAYFADGYTFTTQVLDQKLKDGFPYEINNKTALEVLLSLREQFPINTYFRYDPEGVNDPVLVVGFEYEGIVQTQYPVIRTGLNVAGNWDLEYRNAEDIRLRLKGVINRKLGTKQVFFVGDPDGVVQTRNFYGVTEAMARESLEQELESKKYDGFYGTIKTFGVPYVQHSDAVVIDDPIYTNEKGRYRVEATTWDFTEKPMVTRTLTLGKKA